MTAPLEPHRTITISHTEKLCCLAVVVGTLCYYGSVFFYFALDAGQADDFVDVLWFFEIFLSREHWWEWPAVIALPNHEHVTIINHLLYLLDYALFKQINFFHYELMGNAILLACCWVLADWLKKTVGWWYASAIAIGLFFNLFYWNASFWAMTAISNQIVILFALLAARSVANNPAAIMAPLFWALLAIGSQFNGLLVLPALLASNVFAAYMERRQQNVRQFFVWLLAFLVTTALYCWYESPFAADHLWRYVLYTDPENLQDYFKPSYGTPVAVWVSVVQAFFSWLAAIGATIFAAKQWQPAAIVGAVMLVLLLQNGWRMRSRSDRFFISVLLLVLVSLALVALGRGRAFGAETGLVSRYRLYTSLLLVLLCGSFLHIYAQRWLRYFVLAACVLLQVASLHVLDDIAQERNNIKISHYNWLIDGGMGRSQMPFYPHNQDWRLFNAYQQGYYNPYNAIDDRYKPVAVDSVSSEYCPVSSENFSTAQVRVYSKKARALAVELQVDAPINPEVTGLLFCGQSTYRMMLDARNINAKTQQYEPIVVLKKQLPPSEYRVFLLSNNAPAQVLGVIRFL